MKIKKIVNGRDPVVEDLIRHFEEDPRFQCPDKSIVSNTDKLNEWKADKLISREISVLEQEYYKCATDFRYAARNYFYMIPKDTTQDSLFNLWESQELILERMQYLRDQHKPVKLLTIKARQMGLSLLAESLVAHRAMFSRNVNALVVSYEQGHAQHLFEMLLFIYDHMPWWLKPRWASRKMDTGLHFDNPDAAKRNKYPGLNSKVMVQYATKNSGIGIGTRLNCVHMSEYGLFPGLKKIIEQDMTHALAVDDPGFFAILESTARGTGHYSYKLWKTNVELAESADWYPVFIPWFFEDSRRKPILIDGWKPSKEDAEMKKRASDDWVRCDNPECLQYQERLFLAIDRTDEQCTGCHKGHYRFFELDDDQLSWMNDRRTQMRAMGEDSEKTLKQELASTAEEAFQSSGFQIFTARELDYINTCVEKSYAKGLFDSHGQFHGHDPRSDHYEKCLLNTCVGDHRFDESLWRIWRLPRQGAKYVIGVDLGEGIGQNDSVIFINKVSNGVGPDEQVASFISNRHDPIEIASQAVAAGKYYNNALLAFEINRYDKANTWAEFNLTYSNMYRSRNPASNRFGRTGWLTSPLTKPRITNFARRWLKSRIWEIRDAMLLEQFKTFTHDEDEASRVTGASEGNKDDYVMAAMIAIHASHELDWSENNGLDVLVQDLTLESAVFRMKCGRCEFEWPSDNHKQHENCPQCSCRFIQATRNQRDIPPPVTNPYDDTIHEFVASFSGPSQSSQEAAW